jgi:hypothetical protein
MLSIPTTENNWKATHLCVFIVAQLAVLGFLLLFITLQLQSGVSIQRDIITLGTLLRVSSKASHQFAYTRLNQSDCEIHHISLKYMPHCGLDGGLASVYVKPLLIVGTQRSGRTLARRA